MPVLAISWDALASLLTDRADAARVPPSKRAREPDFRYFLKRADAVLRSAQVAILARSDSLCRQSDVRRAPLIAVMDYVRCVESPSPEW